MFNFVKTVFGQVSVEEKNGIITVSAIHSKNALAEIYSHWKTNRIESGMFTKITPYSFSFYSFFAIEFTYIIGRLMEKPGRSKISKGVLNSVKKGMLENTWLKSTTEDHPKFLNRSRLSLFGKTPLPHQVNFFDRYEEVVPKFQLKGYTLAMGVGSGKTFTSLALAEMMEVDYIIMVSIKASIYRVWEAAMKEDYRKEPEYWIYDRDKVLPNKIPKYIIYHYDALEDLYRNAGRFSGKKVALIFDESHNINELTAARTQHAVAIAEKIQPITTLWASATPIKAMGSEAIPMLTTFDPYMTKPVQDAFKSMYGKNSKKCHDIINHRLGNVIFKVDIVKSNPIIETIKVKVRNSTPFLLETLKKDMKTYIEERIKYWKKQLPEAERVKKTVFAIVDEKLKTKEEIKMFNQYKHYFSTISKETQYDLVKDEMKFCNDYEKTVIAPLLSPELNKQWRSYKSVLKYLDLKVRGECLGNVVAKRREECAIAMIADCDLPKYIKSAEKKTIVFTSYVKAVDDTADYLKKAGFHPISVHGGNGEDLTTQVDKFFKDSNANPLVATYQSLSTSVPLVAANVILALNVPFREYVFEQAVGRIDRINQDTQTYVFKFVLDTGEAGNISSKTLDIMEWSANQVDQILGTTSPVALESLQGDHGHFNPGAASWLHDDYDWIEFPEFEEDFLI